MISLYPYFMNTKLLSNRALDIINQYADFKFANASCSIPYFNNKSIGLRRGLKVHVGKGSPQEIHDELESILVKEKISPDSLTDSILKKILVDHGIGIDCSGFAYYVLNAESLENKKGPLDRHLSFVNCKGIVGKIKCSLNPVGNTDVATIADDRNSYKVEIKQAEPADVITMMQGEDGPERNHILVLHQIEYQNFIPFKIHYSHAVAYPEDGIYGSGIKQGTIEILDTNKSLVAQRWTEKGNEGPSIPIFVRSQKSKTELRRLRWM